MSETPQQNTVGSSGMARYLAPIDVWAIAFGCIIGWGAFVMPGTTFLPIAGPGGTVVAMLISAVIMLIIGMNYAFLMNSRPGTGGVYAYTKEAFGRDHAFLCSWFLSLSYISIVFLNATALFVVSRTLFGDLLQVGYHYNIAGYEIYLGEVALSVGALVLIGLLFINKKPLVQGLQTGLAVVLMLGAVIITAACLPRLQQADLFSPKGLYNGGGPSVVMTIVLLSPWAFVGFDVISLETAHFRFPVKRSGRIIALSILFGAFVYTAMSLVSVTALPTGYDSWQSYIADLDKLSGVAAVPAFYAAQTVMGKAGLAIMGVTALAAILTGVIGAYRATTRVLSTMAEDRILSDKFSSTTFCIIFIMVISIVVSFLGRYALEWFVELTTFGAIVGFGYTSASAFKLAKKAGNRTIMVTSLIGTVVTGCFTVVQLIPWITEFQTMGAASFLMLALWCLLGFVFYWRTMRQGLLSEYHGMSTSSTVLFSLLLYAVMMWLVLQLLAAADSAVTRQIILRDGIFAMGILLVGLVVMLYVQSTLRQRHDLLEREVIRAEESSRAKTQFLFNMSHDIRTPMNAIIGYTNLASKENKDPALAEYLGKIDVSGRHLLELIDDILEMSRIESGTIELNNAPLDLRALLYELRDLFEAQMAEKDLSFSVDASQVWHPYVLADRHNMNRMLLNIVSNAFKFTPEGGDIKVSLWEVDSVEENWGLYELRVQDNGIGMSREFSEKMFTAFERERTSTVSGIQGTGLGLAITKGIVDKMGGTIDVNTAPGNGTEFVIRLRLELSDASQLPEETAAPSSPTEGTREDFTGKRLLLVEDNQINREIATMILREAGFALETAENGRIAVDKVAASEPGYYDAVLMDIQMPEMDGYTATREIRALADARLSAIPIIAMTANAFQEDIQAAKAAGMNSHIAKPLDVDKMLSTLTEVLANR
ncbi:MAG: amino acid permease [Oscillospiraceae bacterium]|nr:amino acid permease [Oscillospiraceae bacterium]